MAAGCGSTGISPRPMLMGAPRNALRAFNAGVSLSCLRVLAHRVSHLIFGLVFVALLFGRGPVLRTCNRLHGALADRLNADRSYPSALCCPEAFFVKVGSVPGIGKGGKGKPIALCQG